jgi:hypothetical protein
MSESAGVVGYKHRGRSQSRQDAVAGRPIDDAENFLKQIGYQSAGIFFGRNKFGEKAEPPGLVIYLGKTWISRQGCAVPAQCSVARRQIGNSEEYLKVPEAWSAATQLRSTNLLYNQIAIIPYILLMGARCGWEFRCGARQPTGWEP